MYVPATAGANGGTRARCARMQTISKMQMLDKGTAQVDWRMTGSLGALPVDISATSVIEMNLLTGRITKQTWVRRCSARSVRLVLRGVGGAPVR